MCLQETLIRHRQALPPSQYDISTSNVTRNDGHERGAAILINKRIQYQALQLQTDLQAAAVRLCMFKNFAIYSLYIPHVPVTYQQLSNCCHSS